MEQLAQRHGAEDRAHQSNEERRSAALRKGGMHLERPDLAERRAAAGHPYVGWASTGFRGRCHGDFSCARFRQFAGSCGAARIAGSFDGSVTVSASRRIVAPCVGRSTIWMRSPAWSAPSSMIGTQAFIPAIRKIRHTVLASSRFASKMQAPQRADHASPNARLKPCFPDSNIETLVEPPFFSLASGLPGGNRIPAARLGALA